MTCRMPDEHGYIDEERRALPAPICPICGALGVQAWREASAMGTGRRWVLGLKSCPNQANHPGAPTIESVFPIA